MKIHIDNRIWSFCYAETPEQPHRVDVVGKPRAGNGHLSTESASEYELVVAPEIRLASAAHAFLDMVATQNYLCSDVSPLEKFFTKNNRGFLDYNQLSGDHLVEPSPRGARSAAALLYVPENFTVQQIEMWQWSYSQVGIKNFVPLVMRVPSLWKNEVHEYRLEVLVDA